MKRENILSCTYLIMLTLFGGGTNRIVNAQYILVKVSGGEIPGTGRRGSDFIDCKNQAHKIGPKDWVKKTIVNCDDNEHDGPIFIRNPEFEFPEWNNYPGIMPDLPDTNAIIIPEAINTTNR